MMHWKKIILLLIAVVGSIFCVAAQEGKAGKSTQALLRHVVLFKFKDEATPEQVRAVEVAFADLPKKINTIVGYEWGTNISPENLAQGYTHCFLVSFKNAAGRDYYLPHPEHKKFGAILQPVLDKVLVIDFVDGR